MGGLHRHGHPRHRLPGRGVRLHLALGVSAVPEPQRGQHHRVPRKHGRETQDVAVLRWGTADTCPTGGGNDLEVAGAWRPIGRASGRLQVEVGTKGRSLQPGQAATRVQNQTAKESMGHVTLLLHTSCTHHQNPFVLYYAKHSAYPIRPPGNRVVSMS